MEPSVPGISAAPALFTVINKDTAELHHELVSFERDLAQRYSDRAVRILQATDAGDLLAPHSPPTPRFLRMPVLRHAERCWGASRHDRNEPTDPSASDQDTPMRDRHNARIMPKENNRSISNRGATFNDGRPRRSTCSATEAGPCAIAQFIAGCLQLLRTALIPVRSFIDKGQGI